ncbi:hypothetical protein IAQ61_011658 [Plenodomus lingam]|uniref:uncharacterized protein n=1 Tax=Leptosphaeria maculans TaxID=5022 RepID=UPI0033239534|nr:hypothetical protein IAQ61_011658 [Plenodomus lingam]
MDQRLSTFSSILNVKTFIGDAVPRSDIQSARHKQLSSTSDCALRTHEPGNDDCICSISLNFGEYTVRQGQRSQLNIVVPIASTLPRRIFCSGSAKSPQLSIEAPAAPDLIAFIR